VSGLPARVSRDAQPARATGGWSCAAGASSFLERRSQGRGRDWLGTLDVYWFELDRVWCWQVTNSRRKLIQDGRDLQMACEQSHEQAMTVLLQFLLATADKPARFHDPMTVWAVMNRKALATAPRDL